MAYSLIPKQSSSLLWMDVAGRQTSGLVLPADSNLINLSHFLGNVEMGQFDPTKFSPQTIFVWGAVLALTALTQPGPPSMVSQLNGWLRLKVTMFSVTVIMPLSRKRGITGNSSAEEQRFSNNKFHDIIGMHGICNG